MQALSRERRSEHELYTKRVVIVSSVPLVEVLDVSCKNILAIERWRLSIEASYLRTLSHRPSIDPERFGFGAEEPRCKESPVPMNHPGADEPILTLESFPGGVAIPKFLLLCFFIQEEDRRSSFCSFQSSFQCSSSSSSSFPMNHL